MATKESKPATLTEDGARWLKCILEDDEKLALGDEMAKAESERHSHEDKLASVSKQIKADIAACEAIIRKNASLLREGYEHRNVPIVTTRNFQERTVVVVRLDIDEEIENRDMRPDEAQMELQKAQE